MKTKPQTETICLQSMPAAAALMTVGHSLVEVKPGNNGRFEFYIRGVDVGLDSADYLAGTLEGSLSLYMSNFDLLRTAIRRGAAL